MFIVTKNYNKTTNKYTSIFKNYSSDNYIKTNQTIYY